MSGIVYVDDSPEDRLMFYTKCHEADIECVTTACFHEFLKNEYDMVFMDVFLGSLEMTARKRAKILHAADVPYALVSGGNSDQLEEIAKSIEESTGAYPNMLSKNDLTPQDLLEVYNGRLT